MMRGCNLNHIVFKRGICALCDHCIDCFTKDNMAFNIRHRKPTIVIVLTKHSYYLKNRAMLEESLPEN